MGYSGAELKKIHLNFHVTHKEGNKLPYWEVFNRTTDEYIGKIHFRGGWRQYVFQAIPEIDMSKGCMNEIIEQIDKAMQAWKATK